MFGRRCIHRWLSSNKRCPSCNATSRRTDIRDLFCSSSIRVFSPSPVVDAERRRRVAAEARVARLEAQLADLHRKLKSPNQTGTTPQARAPTPQPNDSEEMEQEVAVVCEYRPQRRQRPVLQADPDAGFVINVQASRICTHAASSGTNYVVYSSASDLFKTSVVDGHTPERVCEVNSLKDLATSPHSPSLVLAACGNKTALVIDISSNQIVQSYNALDPAWACAWHSTDQNQICIGTGRGQALLFDIRNTSNHLQSFSCGSPKPLHSLTHLTERYFVGATMDGVFLLDRENNRATAALQGPCTSVCVEPSTGFCLASFRRHEQKPAQHIILQLNEDQLAATQTMTGHDSSIALSKSHLFCLPNAPLSAPASSSHHSDANPTTSDSAITSEEQGAGAGAEGAHASHEANNTISSSSAVVAPLVRLAIVSGDERTNKVCLWSKTVSSFDTLGKPHESAVLAVRVDPLQCIMASVSREQLHVTALRPVHE
eukprot:c7171_g1_i1.p1 GENE.c7171_g1_i1~~c7171_g1_i1.p1  ORF type:complete len:528 (-),score=74.96 c7171_g1_i1:36-1496(-)